MVEVAVALQCSPADVAALDQWTLATVVDVLKARR